MPNEVGDPFCHIAIPAPDLEKAKAFYEQVFGWRIEANTPAERYWFFHSGNVGGAFNGRTKPAAGATVLIIRVLDMKAAILKIEQAGGKITQAPSAIGEASPGYDAYFLDPNGNEMGVYSDQL